MKHNVCFTLFSPLAPAGGGAGAAAVGFTAET